MDTNTHPNSNDDQLSFEAQIAKAQEDLFQTKLRLFEAQTQCQQLLEQVSIEEAFLDLLLGLP